jgi:hypothetical protein
MLHIEHTQPARGRLAWCGAPVLGPRIGGVENFIYYEGPGPLCPACIEAVLDVVAVQIAKEETNAKSLHRKPLPSE